MDAIAISRKLAREVDRLRFGPPAAYVYNPLIYAREPFEVYLSRHAQRKGRALLVGMNPGPFGMAQTGVPFGELDAVKNWLRIEGRVRRPKREHPKRPVQGFDCTRSEVSGQRLWGWAKARHGTPARFFRRFFVWNYCPLLFLEESGRNLTPDKLRVKEREALLEVCNDGLRRITELLEPRFVIGIGKFAEKRIKEALDDDGRTFGTILHPSPASPAANRGWAKQAEAQLEELGAYG